MSLGINPKYTQATTRQVCNGPWVVKFTTALCSVNQYFLSKKTFDQKNTWLEKVLLEKVK